MSVAPQNGQLFTLRSANGLTVDVSSSRTTAGNRIQGWKPNGSQAQSWVFWAKDNGSWLLETGLTHGTHGPGQAMVLDYNFSAGVTHLFTEHGDANQRWLFEDAGSGWYRIKSVRGNEGDRYLTAVGEGVALALRSPSWGDPGQRWELLPVGSRPQPQQPGGQGVRITLDAGQAPDLAGWLEAQKPVLETWFPKTVALIIGDAYAAPAEYRIVLDRSNTGVAYASGGMVSVNPDYVRRNPGDAGFLIHEQVHIIQQNRIVPGHFVEGVADWVRNYHFEKGGLPFVRSSDKYTDAYKTTAYFLDHVATHYDGDIVRKLNVAGHDGSYDGDDQWWRARTGKTAQQLWDEIPKR
ncbi:basic secretory protein-like protein [Streptomyces olivoreticuli]